jgi:excisionase family DNA binding protein
MMPLEIEVKEASQRLDLSDSRIRQLLRAGTLRGRRVGNSWLVLTDDVVRLERNRLRAGRPLAPRRAWAALDLLSSGRAPWLSDSARSQVRSHLARLDEPGPEIWLSLLRRRSQVIQARAHPAAAKRLAHMDVALGAGAVQAAERGFDLVAVGDAVAEFYVTASAWPQIADALAIRVAAESNLIVRLPQDVWPFEDTGVVSDAALAADLLESAEPRAIAAGAGRLNELLARWQEQHRRARRSGRQRDAPPAPDSADTPEQDQ